jgi:hypothetical protein
MLTFSQIRSVIVVIVLLVDIQSVIFFTKFNAHW